MKISNRTIALMASLLMIGSLLYFFTDIVAYVCIAWILSMIGQPLMRFFKKIKVWKFRIGPNMAAAFTLIIFLLLIALLMWLFVPPIMEQVNNLAGVDYAAIARALEEPFQRLEEKLAAFGIIETPVTMEEQLKATFSNWFEPAFIGNYFGSLIAAAGNIMVGVASVLFITFFFLKEQGLFVNFLAALMPKQYEEHVRHAISDITNMLSRYFRGLLLQMVGFTLFVTILLYVLGIKNALLIGFFAGLLNIVPYVGPIIGAIFGIILTISSNLEYDFYSVILPKIVKVAIVFGAAQTFDNYVQQPFIFSSSVMAHPLEIFIVILMGAKLGGVTGMVLAIPIYTVLRSIAKVFLSEFNIVQHLTERMEGIGKPGGGFKAGSGPPPSPGL